MSTVPPLSGNAAIGARLRAAREQADISRKQLADITRISKTYLVALENGEFGRLPGTAYVCGFMRAYAAVVGLDGELLVQEYLRGNQPVGGGHVKGHPLRLRVVGPDARRQWAISGILLVLVIAVSSVLDVTADPPKQSSPPAQPAIVYQPQSTAQARISSSATTPALSAPEQDPSLQPSPEQPVTAGGIFLRIKASQDCWLNIDLDGEMGRQYILRPGDVIEWKAANRFSLDVGNAGGVLLEFNGKELQPLGKQGETVHLELTADGAN